MTGPLYYSSPSARRPPRSYVYRGVPHSPGSTWDDVPYALTITVLHFKWHAAVLRNMQDRVRFYKGGSEKKLFFRVGFHKSGSCKGDQDWAL